MRRRTKALLVLVSLLGALTLAVLLGLAWLQGEGGGALLKTTLEQAAGDALAGRVAVRRASLSGEVLTLEHLQLFTPDGELVAEVDTLVAHVDLLALARGDALVRELRLTRPSLHLVDDERGLNLSRALAGKAPPGAGPAGPAPAARPMKVRVARLVLEGGEVDVEGAGPPVALDRLALQGQAELTLAPLTVSASVEGTAAQHAPLEGALLVKATATSPRPGAVETVLAVALADSRVAATVAWPELAVKGLALTLTPAVGAAFVPGWPLAVPLSASGDLSLRAAALRLSAGSAVVTLGGAWDLSAGKVDSFALEVKDADLSELLDGGKPSRLALSASGRFDALAAETLDGRVTVHGVWDTKARVRLAAVDAEVAVEKGALSVPSLLAKLPGVTLAAKGHATRSALGLTGRLEVKDLARLAGVVQEFTGTALPPLAGAGALDLAVSGPLLHPGVSAKGRFQTLVGPGVSVESLDVDARFPDLRRPFNADAHLAARRLRVGETALDEVRVELETQGRALGATLAMKGLGDLRADLSGTVDADSQGLELAALTVRSGEGEWALESPGRIAWPGGRVAVTPLAMTSGGQRLVLSGRKDGARVQGTLDATTLRLEALPRVLVPSGLGLSGALTAHVAVAGRLPRPVVDLTAAWQRGSVKGVSGLEVELHGAWRDGQAKGGLAVATALGRVKGDFTLPVDALAAGRDEAVTLHLEGDGVDVQQLLALGGVKVEVAGVARLAVDVGGTTHTPTLVAAVESDALTVKDEALFEGRPLSFEKARVALKTTEAGTLRGEASTGALGGTVTLAVGTPFTVASLRAKAPTRAELEDTALSVEAKASGLSLAELRTLGLTDDDELTGRVSFEATAWGSAREPKADLAVTLDDATLAPLKGLSGRFTLHAVTALEVALDSSLGGKPLVKVEGRIAAPLAAFRVPESLGAKAVDLRGSVYPVELATLLPGGDVENGTSGVASAAFELKGSLDAPQLSLGGSVQKLAFSRLGLGSARFKVQTKGPVQEVSLAVGGEGRDDLRVKGSVGVDLSLPSVRAGLAVAKAPLDLSVEARQLDVAFLSGVTDLLRVVGGRLDLKGSVTGRVGDPRFRGHGLWTGGRLSVSGYGDYRDISLEANVTNDGVSVPRLEVRSGAGLAHLTARAVRREGETFALTFAGDCERFPVVSDDQLMALVTMKLDGRGDVTPEAVDVKELTLPRVDVELPEVKRKDLQDLERPGDVLVVRGGLGANRRRIQRATEATADRAEGREAPARVYRAVLVAPRNVWVRSSDLNVELGLSEGFRYEYAGRSQMFGEATILRGRLEVIGREFEVQKGSQARFAGPAKEPFVNVVALYQNEHDKEKTTVTVNVTGRGKNVTFKVQSDPPLPEGEIYTLLATGRRELRRGTGSSLTTEQAVSALGAVAASALKGTLAKKLPIDVVNFEAAENFQSVADLKINVGKYLSDSLFIGATYLPGARSEKGESKYAAKLEYQISRQWTAEAWGGMESPAFGVEFVWSRDY